MSATDLLFELGTEELPAGEILAMAAALCQGVTDGLTEASLPFTGVHPFSTPRRLTVWVENVAIKGPDSEHKVVGPPVSAAKDDSGAWTKAAEGFARKQGVSANDLIVVEEQGEQRVAAHISIKGVQAAEVIPDIIANAVAGIPVSKRMRWGRSRDEFLRPVQWLVLLLGDAVLPLQLFGLESGRESLGHRFHQPLPDILDHVVDVIRRKFLSATLQGILQLWNANRRLYFFRGERFCSKGRPECGMLAFVICVVIRTLG